EWVHGSAKRRRPVPRDFFDAEAAEHQQPHVLERLLVGFRPHPISVPLLLFGQRVRRCGGEVEGKPAAVLGQQGRISLHFCGAECLYPGLPGRLVQLPSLLQAAEEGAGASPERKGPWLLLWLGHKGVVCRAHL
ncbi:unnamed protein product, partial [Polarella glacialis]